MLDLDLSAVDFMLDGLRQCIDAAGTPGTLTIHAKDGTRLGSLSLSYPCAGKAEGGALAFHAIAEDPMAAADGKAATARLADGDGKKVFDCSVSDEKGRGVLKLNTSDIRAGGPIRVKSFVLKQA